MRPAPVALLTDFGLDDPYAGQMRAALARAMPPGTPVMDVSHGVPPHAVMSGALFLAASRPYFPDATIFLCVVDPGVGSGRPIHCAVQQGGKGHILLGPGNGLLSLAAERMALETPVIWRDITPSPLAGSGSSSLQANTFHGRAIFPRLAAALRQSADPAALGSPLPAPPLPDWARARPLADGFALTVLHVDRFGDCVLNLSGDVSLPEAVTLRRPPAPDLPLRPATHYAELRPGDVGLLRGSQGYWELACREQSAAALLGIRAGQPCVLSSHP